MNLAIDMGRVRAPRAQTTKTTRETWQRFLRQPGALDATLGEACDLYLAELERKDSRSLIDQTSVIKRHFDPALSAFKCQDLRPIHLEAWIDWQLSEGYAPKTVRKHLSVMASVLELAVLAGTIQANPARQIARSKLPPQRTRDPDRAANEVLEPDQVARMIWDSRIPQQRRWLWTVLFFTGARIGELVALQWRDVAKREPLSELLIQRQWVRKEGRLREPKTGRPRRVPIHPILQKTLFDMERWNFSNGVPSQGESLLCPYIWGGRIKRWNDRTLLSSWRRDLATVGIPEPSAGPRRVHSSRHTFVSLLLRSGVSELVIARMTHPGQSRGPRSSVLIYAHESWPALCDAVLQFPLQEAQRESYARQLSLGGSGQW